MLYYKLKANTNITIYAKNEIFDYFKQIYTFIKGELITKKELEKILKNYKIFNYEEKTSKKLYFDNEEIKNELFEKKEISKNKTYFIFGVRKEIKNES